MESFNDDYAFGKEKRKKLGDITGQVFGKWTVIGKSGTGYSDFLIKCECGKEAIMNAYVLVRGKSSSCLSCYKRKKRKIAGYYLKLKGIVKEDVAK